ncbi:JAB domain-containing protein [Erythrobacter sp.]|jgi:DNA repair protein RadC|uniref:JAB domain-containing protein n=1 Tax=Erythrobacter sp. TaxID=1042 RepID=UPI002EB4BF9A|nr:JAB domain-containing protein [Erythrobacter sp.]
MIDTATRNRQPIGDITTTRSDRGIVDFLRAMVLTPPHGAERFHVLFLDDQRGYRGDAAMGQGGPGQLSVRMRAIFRGALSLDARGIIVAHNHPSGYCRPSAFDIAASRRLKAVARSLDIELLDHLIFTHDAAYSMRAGGSL